MRRKDQQPKLSMGKRLMYSLIESIGAIVGGLLFFVCCYWFFHYETWHERFIAIGLSILVVYLIAKIIPERPNQ
jgi:putative flippase GtrA